MVSLVGSADEILKAIEQQIPEANILVRGNEIHITGENETVALLDQLFAELQVIVRTGATLNPEAAIRSIQILRQENALSPSDVLTTGILSNRVSWLNVQALTQLFHQGFSNQTTLRL